MLALSKAIDEIKARIPRQILDKVFMPQDIRWRQTPPSLDDFILNTVIRPRVLIDCNLIGGVEVYIPLSGVPGERTNDYTTVYRIPKELTQGRSIISVLNITFSNPTRSNSYGINAVRSNTTMLSVAAGVMNAQGSIPMTSTAKVTLIGENVVMVRDSVLIPANVFLRCMLANDENMSHLQLKSYRHFANLCVFAVKAYIYNNYSIDLDLGELRGGMNVGKFKEIIEGYADAEELYQTHLTTVIEKVLLMNDGEAYHNRFLKTIIGGIR